MDTSLGINNPRPVDTATTSVGGKPVSGSGLPQSAKESPAASKTRTLNEAVSRLREQAQSVQRNLEFSVDDASGETVVKVVASDTGEVIRQIPSEVALKLAESLKEAGNLLFSERA
ncbi:flagellar protein FlaG [Pseudomonas nitroreducens]|uniref:Flagellar protein FlaG n=1 Tax=Pseudomonas nitroreducens TaxID=46680 RepID=A0A6G6J0T2_PSENT|nr:flagellar protein FlaG [Pseudomonas nitroreducens]QIE89005.1 flagellar protein FlaG [Pseudomonas nitroreducens]WEW97541.1 flagellar protein FlaG [Pseudomonas nitroreducens]